MLTYLRWWINRYILRRKGAPLEPLYKFEGLSGRTPAEQLYANDRTRAENRAAANVSRPATAETQEPPATYYSSRAGMNF